MFKQRHNNSSLLMISGLIGALISASAGAMDLGPTNISEPLQKERFFDEERFLINSQSGPMKPLVEPQISFSRDVREDDLRLGVKHTAHTVHGEAGGRLNIFGDVFLSTVAKIPVYSYEVTGSSKNSDVATSSDLLRNTGRLSWRSELGVPLGEGVNLNLFYDKSSFGKIDRPGVDEREEKFGTRFIFKFK